VKSGLRGKSCIFGAYEDAANRFGVEKIKSIGDCFMVTAGLLSRFRNPVLSCLFCADEMRRQAAQTGPGWQVRIGVHAGPVVAGMVGKRFTFDVWGDTVNTAQRVESVAGPQEIFLSEPAWAQVYRCCKGKSVGIRSLKGKKAMEIFRFEGFKELAHEVVREA
jgi:class 3 adenylate cyclase